MNIISRMKYRIRHSFVLLVQLAGLFFMSICSNNDCPLSNIVRCYYRFYHSGTGQPASCPDTVSVCIHDSILLNKIVNGNSFNLPMSYSEEEDTIHILFENSAGRTISSFILSHSNIPHYESLECGTSFFHKISGVTLLPSSTPSPIDSIVISQPDVNYNKNENIRIYLSLP